MKDAISLGFYPLVAEVFNYEFFIANYLSDLSVSAH